MRTRYSKTANSRPLRANRVVDFGTQQFGVDEPTLGLHSGHAVLPIEFDVIAEGKELSPEQLADVVIRFHGTCAAGRFAGVSEAFVRQTMRRGKSPSSL